MKDEEARKEAGEVVKLRPPWPRRRWQLVALCVGLFVCGGFVGSFVTAHAMHHFMVKSLRNPDEIPLRMVSHMRRDLSLTDEQADKVLAILRSKYEALASFFRATLDSAHVEVRAVLDDEQAVLWDRRTAKMRAHIFGAAAPEQGGDAPGRDDR